MSNDDQKEFFNTLSENQELKKENEKFKNQLRDYQDNNKKLTEEL